MSFHTWSWHPCFLPGWPLWSSTNEGEIQSPRIDNQSQQGYC